MTRITRTAALVALAIPLAATAQDSNWEGEAELGLLVTTGNSEETNLKGRLGLVHETESWRNIGEFRGGRNHRGALPGGGRNGLQVLGEPVLVSPGLLGE
mgnify:CR=1 FL=1